MAHEIVLLPLLSERARVDSTAQRRPAAAFLSASDLPPSTELLSVSPVALALVMPSVPAQSWALEQPERLIEEPATVKEPVLVSGTLSAPMTHSNAS